MRKVLSSISFGDLYNLSSFSMCAHNGTHVDAPAHFLENGLTVDKISLSKTVGWAYVAECNGTLDSHDARDIIDRARTVNAEAAKRILIKGASVLDEAAFIFADQDIELLGVECQTVGAENTPMAAHIALLQAGTVILEGLRIGDVREGVYFLCAQPLALADSDGAPCRAVLIDFD